MVERKEKRIQSKVAGRLIDTWRILTVINSRLVEKVSYGDSYDREHVMRQKAVSVTERKRWRIAFWGDLRLSRGSHGGSGNPVIAG